MKLRANNFQPDSNWIRWRPHAVDQLAAVGLDRLATLSDRCQGVVVTDHRSSWVRRMQIGSELCYVKTYDYPQRSDRLRGLGRNTALARSRAHREWDALVWLGQHGFARPDPVALLEARRLGFVRRAVLVTASWPGEPLDRLLPSLDTAAHTALRDALDRFVERLHDAGFRDRNLDLRNLLARPLTAPARGWTIAKLDSPRYRLVAPHRDDALRRADRARLHASLRALAS